MSHDLLLILPVAIPLLAAVLGMLTGRSPRVQRIVSVAGMGLLAAASLVLFFRVYRDGILVSQMGGWPAPYGITVVADLLSALLIVVASGVGLAVVVYALEDLDVRTSRLGFHPLLHILLGGVCGAFLAGDIFNLYVWFEVLLIASFVLMALGRSQQQLEATIKYVAINLLASALLLVGIGLLYGTTGTLNMADLATRIASSTHQEPFTAISMFFVVAFGIKAAAFPLFFWLPASYHTPPIPVAALFAGLLTKVGVYAMLRVFTLLFTHDVGYTHTLLLWMAGGTMLVGVLGALVEHDLRRRFAFLIVGTVGFMLMGIGVFTPLGLTGTIFYVIEDVVVITNLFLITGLVRRTTGERTLYRLGGLYRDHPYLSALFLIPALSLAAFPPLSGFWAKFILGRAGFESGQYAIVAVMLVAGLLILLTVANIWHTAFLAPAPPSARPAPPPDIRPARTLLIPVVGLTTITLILSLFAAPFYELAGAAAESLMNPDRYIEAVLHP